MKVGPFETRWSESIGKLWVRFLKIFHQAKEFCSNHSTEFIKYSRCRRPRKWSSKSRKVHACEHIGGPKPRFCTETLCEALGTQHQIFRAKRQFPPLHFIACVYTRRKIVTQSTQVSNYASTKMFRRHAEKRFRWANTSSLSNILEIDFIETIDSSMN